jgi:non-ribosomal peptide synthase protein (TIGR01720 family)
LKDIARRGVAYGALRFLARDERVRAELSAAAPAEVAFLYLGQSRRPAGEASTSWRPADLGRAADPQAPRSHRIQVVAQVRDGVLWTEWIYSKALHNEGTVERLADGLIAALREIAKLGTDAEPAEPAPEDFPAARIAKGDLDALMKRLGGCGKR